MDRRLLLVLSAGAVIAGVCAYRWQTNQPHDYAAQLQAAMSHVPAPPFEGIDENNQMFRLTAYLGRHRVIVVFYDGEQGVARSPELIELRDRAGELKRLDVKVVAISQAIPQQNRESLKQLGGLPAVLISDVHGTIHERWGRMSKDGRPLTGLFLIDRKGTVAFESGSPRPYPNLDELWKDLRS